MSDRNGTTRTDGALIDAYAAIGNPLTGLGTHRDPLQHSEVNLAPHILSERDLEALYRSSRICEKAICLLPQAAGSGWVDWEMGEADVEASDINDYVKRIKARKGFVTAGLLGRLYGDAYLLLGIDDGQSWDLPINESNIRSIRWSTTLTKCEIHPDWGTGYTDYEDPEFYRFFIGSRKIADGLERSQVPTRIHKSRILRFPGKRLYSELLQYTAGENDSVIQAMFNAFNAWSMSMSASSAMMTDYSLFIYKLNGFAKLILDGNKKALMERFTSIQMGKSVLKGLMMDTDNEDASFIQRNYSGVRDILEEQKNVLTAEAGMPASKLFGSPQGSAFSESGLSDRYEWAACVESYEDSFWRENLEILQRYILLARDGPTGGVLPDDYGFSFRSVLQLTRQEEADLKFKHAQADGLLIRNKILHPKEIRSSRFSGAEYGDNITLDPDVEEELFAPEPEPVAPQQQQQNPPATPPTDEQTTNQDGVDLQRLDQLRTDASLGLIPRAVYLEAAGYRTDEIESGLRDELKRDAQAIAPNPMDADNY